MSCVKSGPTYATELPSRARYERVRVKSGERAEYRPCRRLDATACRAAGSTQPHSIDTKFRSGAFQDDVRANERVKRGFGGGARDHVRARKLRRASTTAPGSSSCGQWPALSIRHTVDS